MTKNGANDKDQWQKDLHHTVKWCVIPQHKLRHHTNHHSAHSTGLPSNLQQSFKIPRLIFTGWMLFLAPNRVTALKTSVTYKTERRILREWTIQLLVQVCTARLCVDRPGKRAGNRRMHLLQNTVSTQTTHITTMSLDLYAREIYFDYSSSKNTWLLHNCHIDKHVSLLFISLVIFCITTVDKHTTTMELYRVKRSLSQTHWLTSTSQLLPPSHCNRLRMLLDHSTFPWARKL